MARANAGKLRRWGPYAGLLITAAMMTISSNIVQSDGVKGQSGSAGEEGHRYLVRHIAGESNVEQVLLHDIYF